MKHVGLRLCFRKPVDPKEVAVIPLVVDAASRNPLVQEDVSGNPLVSEVASGNPFLLKVAAGHAQQIINE